MCLFLRLTYSHHEPNERRRKRKIENGHGIITIGSPYKRMAMMDGRNWWQCSTNAFCKGYYTRMDDFFLLHYMLIDTVREYFFYAD